MNASAPATIKVDVAIVGGGVAGASLAATLADAGLGVAVVEREARFRDRIRGEALHPWGAREADRLGLLPVLRAAGAVALPLWQRYEARTPGDPYCWADDTPGGYCEWSISHPALQAALLRHAACRGARVLRPARVAAYHLSARPEIEVATNDGNRTVAARLVVGADGARSRVRAWLGAGINRDPVRRAIGGALLDGVALPADRAHQAYLPGGFAMLFPQGAGRARAYVVCSAAAARHARSGDVAAHLIATCAAALPAGALGDVRPAGPAAFFPAADVWSDRLAAGPLVLIGDAAGANDPSQGHGLALAFRDVRELRDLLLSERDWPAAVAAFAARRAADHAVLRAHAEWAGTLAVAQGPEADAMRSRVARARERDPTAGGFAAIYACGPDGLTPDETARRRFFGLDG